jgi:hypothetical protein
MKMGKVRFGLILAIMAMAIVSGACIPSAPQSTPTPGANQPPVISSLTSAQTQVLPSSIIEIRCVASDPDGDNMSYEWSTTGGRFSGAGPTVSWIAPEDYGTWDVKVTVKDGKGGIIQGTIKLSVVANHDPQVLSLVAEPATVLPQGRSTITCVATDADGDVLNYRWEASASDSSITGTGATVTWIAPDREGEFTITVTVDDGKGGQSGEDVSVTVRSAEKTVTLTLLANESGTVSSTGDRDNSLLMAGDDDKDVGQRAFFSFDISSLKGTEIRDAKLNFTTGKVYGEPFSKGIGLGGLRLWHVSDEQGQLPDYNTARTPLLKANEIMWEPPTVPIDVTAEVRSPLLTPAFSIHLQFEASFLNTADGDHVGDYVRWTGATLTVTYVEK